MADAWIGWAGMALLVVSFLPAALKTMKSGKGDMKLSFLAPYLAGVILTLIYSWQIGEMPFIALNIALLLLVALETVFSIKHGKKGGKAKKPRRASV